jgi:hypothetical protein
MSLGAYRTGLVLLTRDLSVRWDQTRERWRDAQSQEFEKRFLEDLRLSVDRTAAVIEELDKLLTRIRNDCA